ncbi:MAG TPA: type 2 lanthipeptide synthetase LanM family protein, partial [Ktedonobacteraceae bacterium]|nr:type 2 lanthipeptide synthetase LanM family protein [Ktedonobacteraceae bacterium]
MKDSIMSSCSSDDLSSYSDEAWYRAYTLRERLTTSLPQLVPTDEDGRVNWRLQRWKNERPYQHGIDFHKRLAEDNLTEDGLFALLQEKASLLQARLTKSEWMTELEQALLSSDRVALSELLRQAGASVGQEIRCLDAFSPLIKGGITRVREGIQALADRYPALPFASERILLLLLPGLLSTLFTCSLKVFTLELHIARLQGKLSKGTSEERFDEFVNILLCQNQLSVLLAEYPVLARQLQLAVDFWVNNSLEMLGRLCADWPELCTLFADNGDPGQLSEITSGDGDMHCGGHAVATLRFSSGLRLVYKPKSLMVDKHFQELLGWLNKRGDHPPFRLTNLLVRDRYGWSEFIQAESCASVAEVERFYERLGAYLAVLYALDAVDFHFENLIAAGEQPMLIDLEALFHPRIGGRDSVPLLLQPFQRSVMRVGLLPGRILSKNEHAGLEVSGVGGYGGQQSLYPVAQWKQLNTDEMHLVREYTTLAGQHNRPRLQGEEVDVLDYGQALVRGFMTTYRLLIRERETLIAGPLQRFASDEIRLIVRPTAYYAQLLQESFHPDLLRDALDSERYFDNLWLATIQQPYLESFIQAERNDLWSGDIPLFRTTPGTCTVLTSGGECIDGGIEEPTLEVVKRIIEELDETDLRRQCWFIEASLATMLLGKSPQNWRYAILTHSLGQESTREKLLQEACAIADHICDMALCEGESASWLGLSLVGTTQWRLVPLAPELYNGIPGIVLFLAYLGKITGVRRYTDVAQAGLNSLHIQVEQAEHSLKTIGGFDGWGSLLYLYTHLAVLWNEPSYYYRTEQIVTYIAQLVEQDENLDVIRGSAGAI